MSGPLRDRVIALLSEGWSPEQIAGRQTKEERVFLSYEAIYHFVSQG